MIKNQVPQVIKTIAKKYFEDADVLLFGSRARQSHSNVSDYDILIVTGKNISVKEKIMLRTSIRKNLLALGIRSDILIQSKAEVDKKKKLPGHFIKSIMKDAILL